MVLGVCNGQTLCASAGDEITVIALAGNEYSNEQRGDGTVFLFRLVQLAGILVD